MLKNWAKNKFGEYFLPAINGSAFESVDSSSFYHSFYPQIALDQETFYLFIGSDSGLFLDYLQHITKPTSSRYLFIEPDVIFHAISTKKQLATDPQCALSVFEHWESAANDLGFSDYMVLERVKIICSLGALDNYYSDYAHFRSLVERAVEQVCWKGRLLHAGADFIEQQMKNLTENDLPASVLVGAFKGMTAVLLAGGPSLDGAIEWVKTYKDKLLVVSVSRISQRLLEVGLIPDIIVSIDPTEKMFEVSKQMLKFEGSPLFVAAYHVTSLLPAVWHGRHVYLGNRVPWKTDFNPDNVDVMGPTVTNSAIHLLVAMGVSQIILAGVDLSYSEEGYSHAKGSLEYAAGARLDFQGQQIELNDGSFGQTENAFFEATHTLALQALEAKELECVIINYSAKAAKISGVQFIPLEEISLPSPDIHPSQRLDHCIKAQPVHFLNYAKQCQKELTKIEKKLKQVAKLSREAMHLHDRDNLPFSQIDNIEAILNEEYADILTLIKIVAYRSFLDIFRAKILSLKDADPIMQASRRCFASYLEGALIVLGMIKSSQQRLKDRIAEYAKKPDISRLLTRWKADQQFGRTRIWLSHHRETADTLTAIQRADLEDMLVLFEAQMNFKMTIPARDLSNYGEFRAIQHQLYRLFRQSQSAKLHALEKFLASLTHPNSQLLVGLARAYQYELAADYPLAITQYYHCAKAWLLETALNHLSQLLLKTGDIQNARIALESLSYLGHQYLPNYAQLCVCCGDLATGISAYENYLEICELDVAVQTKLAALYQQTNQNAKLQAILSKIQAEPNYCHLVAGLAPEKLQSKV